MYSLISDAVTTTSVNYGPLVISSLIGYVLAIIPFWVIFTKAGEAGWQAIIPIWNWIVLLKIVGKPIWWIILLIIPIVQIVILILVLHALSLSFGHGAGFTVGLIFLSLIFYYVLAFSSNTYRGPNAAGGYTSGYAPA